MAIITLAARPGFALAPLTRDRRGGQLQGDDAHQLVAGAAGGRVDPQLITGRIPDPRHRRAQRDRSSGQDKLVMGTRCWPAAMASDLDINEPRSLGGHESIHLSIHFILRCL
jgi:hypothetical protein